MNAIIEKHGDGYYTIKLGSCRGHKNTAGQMLAAPDLVTLNFRFPEDPPGVNLDPVDLLSVLHSHLEKLNPAAAEAIETAVEALSGGVASAPKKPAGEVVKRLGAKRGPKPKQPVTEEAA